MKKLLWIIAVLAVGIVLAVVALVCVPADDQVSQQHDQAWDYWVRGWKAAARVAADARVRVMYWPVCRSAGEGDPAIEGCESFEMSEDPMVFEPPTDNNRKVFWDRIYAAWSGRTGSDLYPRELPCEELNEEQLDKYEQALVIARRSVEPEGFWYWSQTWIFLEWPRPVPTLTCSLPLDILEPSVCLRTEEAMGEIPHDVDGFGLTRLLLSGEELEMESSRLAAVLIHHATHASYHASLATDGYDRRGTSSMMVALLTCGDVRMVERQESEALAYLNQYLWSERYLVPRSQEEADLWQIAKSARAGDVGARLLFAHHVQAMSLADADMAHRPRWEDMSGSDWAQLLRTRSLACGPFPNADRRLRAHYAFPTDREPDFLPDMLGLFRIRRDERCDLNGLYLGADPTCSFAFPGDVETFNHEVLGI